MLSKHPIRHLIPACLLLLLIFIVYLWTLHHPINLELIQAKKEELQSLANKTPFTFTCIFLGVYIVSVILVIPDSSLLSLAAGIVYPLPIAFAIVCFAETVGATLFFLIIRYTIQPHKLQQSLMGFLPVIKKYHQNPASYLLFFRFSHILPFWLINLLAASLKTGIKTYIWTAFLGVAPFAFLFVKAGQDFSKSLDGTFSFHEILNTQTKLLLLALALFALVPILIRKIWKRY